MYYYQYNDIIYICNKNLKSYVITDKIGKVIYVNGVILVIDEIKGKTLKLLQGKKVTKILLLDLIRN